MALLSNALATLRRSLSTLAAALAPLLVFAAAPDLLNAAPDATAASRLAENGRQETKVTNKIGAVEPGSEATLVAKVKAYGDARDNVTFGVLGTRDGDVIAVERMPGLGSGVIKMTATMPDVRTPERLYFRIVPVVTPERAREAFGPRMERVTEVGIVKPTPNCSAPSLCFQSGRQEVKVFREAGYVRSGEVAKVGAKVKAYGDARDNITFGVLGTAEGEVVAVERMNDTGTGVIKIASTLPDVRRTTILYFRIAAVTRPEQARNAFGPSRDAAVPVGKLVADDGGDDGGDEPNRPPKADADGPKEVVKNDAIRLSGAGSNDGDGSIETYSWTVRNLQTNAVVARGNGRRYTPVISRPGTYSATLTVTDDDGASASDLHKFAVTPVESNAAPDADIDGPRTVVKNNLLRLSGTSSSDEDGRIVEYQWSIKHDGRVVERGSGATFETTLQDVGRHSVTLTVTDDDGAMSGTSGEFVVVPFEIDERF